MSEKQPSEKRRTEYDAIADAVQTIADAAAEAFRKAGIEPGEWDSDDIVRDVARGIANDIERAVLAEREACAQVADKTWQTTASLQISKAAGDISRAIRARGQA